MPAVKRIDVRYSRKFLKQVSRFPRGIIEQVQEKEEIFKSNPFEASLNTHKLHGKEKELWAFNINRSYRIKFIFLKSNEALFLEIGTHDIYR